MKKKLLLVFAAVVVLSAILWAAVGTTTISSFDRRVLNINYPVWEHVITYTFGDGDSTATTQSVPLNGILQKVMITSTDAGGSITAFTIADNADLTVFSSGALADALPFAFSVHEPLSGTVDVIVTPADPGGAYVVTVTLRGI